MTVSVFTANPFGRTKKDKRAHGTIITSLWRQNDVATSFWRHNDVIIALSVRWETTVVLVQYFCMSYLYHGISYTGKTASLYWNDPTSERYPWYILLIHALSTSKRIARGKQVFQCQVAWKATWKLSNLMVFSLIFKPGAWPEQLVFRGGWIQLPVCPSDNIFEGVVLMPVIPSNHIWKY